MKYKRAYKTLPSQKKRTMKANKTERKQVIKKDKAFDMIFTFKN